MVVHINCEEVTQVPSMNACSTRHMVSRDGVEETWQ